MGEVECYGPYEHDRGSRMRVMGWALEAGPRPTEGEHYERRKRHTRMVQMLPHLHIAMPPRRDVKVTLHLVPLQTPINPTARPRHTPSQPRRLLEPSLFPPVSQHMRHMRILLLLLGQILPLPLQRVHPLDPLSPVRGVLGQHVAREYAIARGVLHVDVEVETEHGDYDVEVDLQVVGDSLLHAEEMRFVARIPAAQLGEGQYGAD